MYYYRLRKADTADAPDILNVTKRAFVLYQEALHSPAHVKALDETLQDTVFDIENHDVYVAEENGKIIGSIRCLALSDELAYIYRFGVDPEINNTGVGSDLLNLVIEQCEKTGIKAIALHTNAKYYRLARYYYGKQFFVHSTSTAKGYIRALFIKELTEDSYDLTPAFEK